MNTGSGSNSNSNVQRIGTVAYSLAKEAAKFSKKFSEEIVEKSKEISQSTQLYDTNGENFEEIKILLDSKYETEKLDGLKRLIAMIAKGHDCSKMFPSVVKNVAVNSIEIRRLVYNYLLRYANKEQELALLTINTFQKELSDKNPEIRALAIRVMSSIKITAILPILIQGIQKTITDTSILVRQAAANSLIKCYQMDPENKAMFVDLVQSFLKETSPYVIGNVINAFNKICPERLDLIHIHYRRLCKILVDVDSWSQIAIFDLLLRYGKSQFVCPYKNNSNNSTSQSSREFYDSEEENEFYNTTKESVDPDLRLLLNSCKPILQSSNFAVILKIVTIYYYLAPKSEFSTVALSLLRYPLKGYEQQYIILQNILSITNTMPEIFKPYVKSFFVDYESPFYIKELQMKILVNLTEIANSPIIYNEFHSYIRSEDSKLSILTMECIAMIAKRVPTLAENFLKLLMSRIMSKNEQVSAECIIVIRQLLQIRPDENSKIIKYLIKILPNISVPKAKANLIWLIGQYCKSVLVIVPDTLREFAKKFTKEDIQVKYQIINLGAKLVSVDPQPTNVLLFQYVLNLARYDLNYDLRDRARFYKALVLDPILKFNKDTPENEETKETKTKEEESGKKEGEKEGETTQESPKEKSEESSKVEEEAKETTTDNDHSNEPENQNHNTQTQDNSEVHPDTTTTATTTTEGPPLSEKFLEKHNVDEELKNSIINQTTLEELLINLQKLLLRQENFSIQGNSEDEEKYTLGSLSHSVNRYVKGYVSLPEWPKVASNPTLRGDFNTDLNEKSFSSIDNKFSEFISPEIKRETSNKALKKRYITLDEFYSTSEDEDDEEEEEEEDDDEEKYHQNNYDDEDEDEEEDDDDDDEEEEEDDDDDDDDDDNEDDDDDDDDDEDDDEN